MAQDIGGRSERRTGVRPALAYAQPNEANASSHPDTPTLGSPTWVAPGAPKRPKRAKPVRPTTRAGRVWRWARRALLVAIILALLTAVGLGYSVWRLSATVTNYPGAHFNQGRNAVWLEHEWAGQTHTSAEYDQLAAQLRREQITYVYAHVGPLDSDGTIPDSIAPNAQTFVAAMGARLPQLRVLAWIGQLEAASGQPADQVVNLADSHVRTHIAQTAERFVAMGYSGVHYDIEPIRNNDPDFISLLTETRAALPAGAMISISGEKWAPSARVAALFYHEGRAGAWWTSYFYAAVAAHVDQIAVMTYDSGMPTAGAYQLFVKEETSHVLDAALAARHPPQVLIGAPTYTGDSVWFHSSAENMRSALAGVTAGLNSDTHAQPFVGVAIYRYGVTTPADWTTYDQLWLGQRS